MTSEEMAVPTVIHVMNVDSALEIRVEHWQQLKKQRLQWQQIIDALYACEIGR